jgi:hypothetical protein
MYAYSLCALVQLSNHPRRDTAFLQEPHQARKV